MIFFNRIRLILDKLLQAVCYRLNSCLNNLDDSEDVAVIPALNAAFLSLLSLLVQSSNYDWFIRHQDHISAFLQELFTVLQLIVGSTVVYPTHWIQLKLLSSFIIISTIKAVSQTLFKLGSQLYQNFYYMYFELGKRFILKSY